MNMSGGNFVIELYNRAKDVGEKTNIATKHLAVVEQLGKLMEEQHTKSELFPLPPFDVPVIGPNEKSEGSK